MAEWFLSVRHFESLPHGQVWYLPCQAIDWPRCFSSMPWLLSRGLDHRNIGILRFGLSMVARPADRNQRWGRDENIPDIHRDFKVGEKQTMKHLFARGHSSFLPALGFCAECKASFSLLGTIGCFPKQIEIDGSLKGCLTKNQGSVLGQELLPFAFLFVIPHERDGCTDAVWQGLLNMPTSS